MRRSSIFRRTLIHYEAGKDGLHSYAVDRHEHNSNGEGGDEDQDEEVDGLLDVAANVVDEGDQQVE